MFRRIALGVLGAVLCVAAAYAASAPTVVRVETGQLKGEAADGVLAFKGVPFAAAPVGELRWRPPQKAPAWTGVRDATKIGKDCLQGPIPNDPGLGVDLSEDCLFVNVWRPTEGAAKKLPVLVWIYGGGLVNGGTQPAIYQGDAFARHGLVVVSLNYRVGRFGFFAHPALSAERPDELKGNYAFMDQIAALQWVKRNIAAFGGDPGNVTVFGESAGGFSIHTLMASPLGKGLFQRAIVESGGGRDALGAAPNLAAAEASGVAFAKASGIEGADAAALAKLRTLPADTVTGGLSMRTFMTTGAATYSGPITDGRLIVEPPGAAYKAGRGAKVALISGANSADLGFNSSPTLDALLAPFGTKKDAALAVYDPEGKRDLRAIRTKVGMDQTMLEPARFAAATFAAHGQPAWHYRFDYVGTALKPRVTNGAPHASELPYVFGTYGPGYLSMVAPNSTKEASAADLAMSKAIQAYWANFAKTGDPNGPGLPKWPKYDAAGDQTMVFRGDGVVSAGPDPWKARLDLAATTQR